MNSNCTLNEEFRVKFFDGNDMLISLKNKVVI